MTDRAVGGPTTAEAPVGSGPRQRSRRRTRSYASLLTRSVIGLLVIVVCYVTGEWLAGMLRLPVPGSVLGMVLLFLVLCIQPVRLSDRCVTPVAEKLVALIPFLLVPAAVGVVDQLADIVRDAPALVAAVVGGWIVTLLVSALAAKLLLRHSDKRI